LPAQTFDFNKNQGGIRMEYAGYILLIIVVACWLIAMLVGMVAAFPVGIIGLVAIVGIGFLFAKVVKDRLSNKEDDYYAKNIKQ
jgi:Flp pilus assembly protein TadB